MFTNKRIPYCVKFNPDADKQNQFLAGCSDKKIVQVRRRRGTTSRRHVCLRLTSRPHACAATGQWDVNTGEIVQEYDQHLAAVNSITFVDDNRRFISTSDDKTVRVWDWGFPVVIKYIADPTMHSMPSVAVSPNSTLQPLRARHCARDWQADTWVWRACNTKQKQKNGGSASRWTTRSWSTAPATASGSTRASSSRATWSPASPASPASPPTDGAYRLEEQGREGEERGEERGREGEERGCRSRVHCTCA